MTGRVSPGFANSPQRFLTIFLSVPDDPAQVNSTLARQAKPVHPTSTNRLTDEVEIVNEITDSAHNDVYQEQFCAVPPRCVAPFLAERHYLGWTGRGMAWSDEFGVLILAKPTSRRLPQDGTWLELVRWCLVGMKNGGSRQWKRVRRWLRHTHPEVTTVVSYSDPSVGHTGALYKACGWRWAPTWHRLNPPPTGNGSWKSRHGPAGSSPVKDRWICDLAPDARRDELLRVKA